MAHNGNTGQAVPIVKVKVKSESGEVKSESGLSFDFAKLEEILLADHVKNLPVVVVSVAGAFRGGKSFLLNFFLRYMRNRMQQDWMADLVAPLEGFLWRGGSDPVTNGILIWSEVFVVPTNRGKEVAVVFLDTQGMFDTKTTSNECAGIFALSMMASSVQIYNISQNIGEDDLQHLQLFAQYGKLVLKETGQTLFQKLLFLVRDWENVEEKPFGFEGGEALLQARLLVTADQAEELKSLREDIKSCFTNTSCFLMPEPGKEVKRKMYSPGRLCDIDEDFKEQLKVLVPSLLGKDKLEVKKICGRDITCQDLFDQLEIYARIFNKGDLPHTKSGFETAVDANNSKASDRAIDRYNNDMEKAFDEVKPYLDDDTVHKKHEAARDSALELFDNVPKFGGKARSTQHRANLMKKIDQEFKSFRNRNEGQRIKSEEQKIKDDARQEAKSIVAKAEASARRIMLANSASQLTSVVAQATPIGPCTTVAQGLSATFAAYGTGECAYRWVTQPKASDTDKKED